MNEMPASPTEVVGQWLQNLLDHDVVDSLVAPDATYVSLNTDDAELSKILSRAGTARGPQAFLDNFGKIFTRWESQAFNVATMFASGENVAVFGDFRYKSKSLGKVVSSPFSILVKVVDGKVTYLQFLEDSYATAASFSATHSAPASPPTSPITKSARKVQSTIGQRLYISAATVKFHVGNIMQKLGRAPSRRGGVRGQQARADLS